MNAVHNLIKISVMPELDLEAERLAQLAIAGYAPESLRARVAGRLVRLALQLDRDAAQISQN